MTTGQLDYRIMTTGQHDYKIHDYIGTGLKDPTLGYDYRTTVLQHNRIIGQYDYRV